LNESVSPLLRRAVAVVQRDIVRDVPSLTWTSTGYSLGLLGLLRSATIVARGSTARGLTVLTARGGTVLRGRLGTVGGLGTVRAARRL
jgi:hypothetical protein